MQMPSQAQINSALRSAGMVAGTTASVFVVLGVLSADQSAAVLAGVHQIIDGLQQVFGGAAKVVAIVGPIGVTWIAKWGVTAASLHKQLASITSNDNVKIEGKILVPPEVAAAVPSPQVVAKTAAALALFVCAWTFFGAAQPAMAAEGKKSDLPVPIALPCDPANLLPGCKQSNGSILQAVTGGKSSGASTGYNSDGTPTCDFTTFTIITPQNVLSLLQACGQRLLDDSNAALASAKAANDTVAANCLGPGSALVQAAIGTPAVPAKDAVPANGSTPAQPAVPEQPAQLGGPVLLFQKFREFVDNAGITNCKAWVNNTITSATASGL